MSRDYKPSGTVTAVPAATGGSFLRALLNTLLAFVVLLSVALLLAWVGMAT